MKVCILGDTHFGVRNDSDLFHRYFEKFYSEVFFPYLEKNNITTVFQLGDLFDKKKNVNFYTLSRARSYFFNELKRRNINLIVNVGNHDTFYKHSNEISAPKLLLKDYSNITVIDYPQEFYFPDDDKPLFILPWLCKANLSAFEKMAEQTSASIVLGHLELAGFSMYRGFVTDHGMDPQIFRKFDMVLTGHFHHRSSNGNIHYVGTPYELTWADYDDPKGFHILDIATRELEFIPNPFNMFHKVEYDDAGVSIEEVIDFDVSAYADSYVKVVATNKTNPFIFDAFVKKIEDVAADVKVTENALVLLLDDCEVEDMEDTLSLLVKVVEETETNVPKEKLNDLMLDLFTEASRMEVA